MRVLVVGQHDLATTSIVAALRTHGLDAQEWGAGDLLAPDPGGLVVFSLPVQAGLVAAALRSGWRVLAVFDSGDIRNVASAVAEGAAAVVPRSAPLEELLAVMMRLAAGGAGMRPEERQTCLRLHRSLQVRTAACKRRIATLTDREFDVLRRIERGQRAADIAQDAVLATSTVRTHIRSILEKLEVHSQHQAVEIYREALRHGG